ncbi:MAG: hypothetical protein WBP57_08445 [Ignavibacteria bacterium]|jgi:hypothetical protein|nr:MAG: hypothetical protein UZ04_CHB001001449 [Chlorobi bacterium OLB4]MBV6399594.1 hypothetical protein [Ignavibacteria bacterium]
MKRKTNKKTTSKVTTIRSHGQNTPAISLEEQIKRDKIKRVTQCKEVIESALLKNNCRLICSVVVSENGNSPIIDIIANDNVTT